MRAAFSAAVIPGCSGSPTRSSSNETKTSVAGPSVQCPAVSTTVGEIRVPEHLNLPTPGMVKRTKPTFVWTVVSRTTGDSQDRRGGNEHRDRGRGECNEHRLSSHRAKPPIITFGMGYPMRLAWVMRRLPYSTYAVGVHAHRAVEPWPTVETGADGPIAMRSRGSVRAVSAVNPAPRGVWATGGELGRSGASPQATHWPVG
jgi:hypothetical protein